MPNNVGVRQYLQGQGIGSNDVGYDKNTGYVTVKGQNFIKPAANLAGTTYDSQQNLDSAYGNYGKQQSIGQPVILPDGSVGKTSDQTATPVSGEQQGSGQSTPEKAVSAQYTNPYTQQIAELMKHLSESNAALNQPVDVYSTPQYAAAQANQQRQAANSIRHASESAAGAGLGHSTIMTDRTQGIQNDSDAYLATQLVPQIMAQIQAQKQQEYQNEQAQFNNILGLSDRADANYNANRNFDAGRQDAETAATGIYNPSGLSYQEAKAQMEKNSAAYETATPEEKIRLHDENLQLGEMLGQTYDSKTGTYSKDQGYVGTKTMTAKQLDSQLDEVAYNHARDSLLDSRYETKFNQDIQQQGFENALKIALQKHQISNDNAQIAISQQNADTSKTNSDNSQANAELDNARSDTAAASKNYQDSFNNLVSLYTAKDPETGVIAVTNPVALRAAIIAKNMDDDLTIQMLTDFGLPIKKGG